MSIASTEVEPAGGEKLGPVPGNRPFVNPADPGQDLAVRIGRTGGLAQTP